MSMFNNPQTRPDDNLDEDQLEATRQTITRHPVLTWQSVGTFVEFAVVDYNDKAAVKDGGVQKTRVVQQGNETVEKKVTQDVITGLVLGGNTLVTSPVDRDRLDVVTNDLVVTQFVSGHNRWDPDRPQEHGKTWRDAKDVLGRGLMTGDLVRIDYVAFLEVARNGRKLQNGKKVLAFQVRPLGGTPEELAILEKARAARRALKASTAPSQPVFQPPTTVQAQPAAPSAAAPAAAARGLFD